MLAGLGGLIALAAIGLFAVVWFEGTHPWRGRADYVALGSSFGAGPGIFPREARSPLLCAQSQGNYAHLIARDRALSLVDRTCSGATTRHVLYGGQYFQPAQIEAIGPQTRLVTVTIGGNDAHFAENLVSAACTRRGLLFRMVVGCRVWPEAQVSAGLDAARTNLRLIAADVHRRAPQARLVFVGYFRLLPDSGTCPALGMDAGAADRARHLAARLGQITRDAAHAAGATFVDLDRLGHGHDACSSDPWVNGASPTGALAAPFHPTAAGMRAAATAIELQMGPINAR